MSLFIGNISKNVRKSDLIDDFEKFGKCDINFKVLLEALLASLLSMLFGSSPLLCFILLTPLLIGIFRFH